MRSLGWLENRFITSAVMFSMLSRIFWPMVFCITARFFGCDFRVGDLGVRATDFVVLVLDFDFFKALVFFMG